MKRYSLRLFALIFLVVLCFFNSCSKETFSEEEKQEESQKSNYVTFDNSKYKVYYISTETMPKPGGSLNEDKDYCITLFLEDSESPKKELLINCVNYNYGEKIDLATDKYQSRIIFDNGEKTQIFRGGSLSIKQGSYYVLSRKDNHIELELKLIYSGDNDYVHKLEAKYSGELPEKNYLPL